VFRRPGDKLIPDNRSAKVVEKFSRLAQIRANRPACPTCNARDTYSNGNRERDGVKTPYYRCGKCNRSFSATEAEKLEDFKPVSTKPILTEPISTEPISTEPISTEPISTEPNSTEPISTNAIDSERVETILDLILQPPINPEAHSTLETSPKRHQSEARVVPKQATAGSIGLLSFAEKVAEQKPPVEVTEQTESMEPSKPLQAPEPKLFEPKSSESQSLEPQPQEKPQPEIQPLEPSPWPTQRTLEHTRPLVWTLPDVQNLMLESSRTHQQNLALFAHPGIPEAVLNNMSEPIRAYLHSRQALDLATALWQCLNTITARESLTELSKPDEVPEAEAVKTAEAFAQLEQERDEILIERNQLQNELTTLSRQKFKLEAELANVRASAHQHGRHTPQVVKSVAKAVDSAPPTPVTRPSFSPSKSNRIAPPLYTVPEQRELQRRASLLVATLARCEQYRLRVSDVSTVTGDPGPWRVALEYAITSKLVERQGDFVQITVAERVRRKLP
jgi:hypothetical protein